MPGSPTSDSPVIAVDANGGRSSGDLESSEECEAGCVEVTVEAEGFAVGRGADDESGTDATENAEDHSEPMGDEIASLDDVQNTALLTGTDLKTAQLENARIARTVAHRRHHACKLRFFPVDKDLPEFCYECGKMNPYIRHGPRKYVRLCNPCGIGWQRNKLIHQYPWRKRTPVKKGSKTPRGRREKERRRQREQKKGTDGMEAVDIVQVVEWPLPMPWMPNGAGAEVPGTIADKGKGKETVDERMEETVDEMMDDTMDLDSDEMTATTYINSLDLDEFPTLDGYKEDLKTRYGYSAGSSSSGPFF
jgi:hypothetical protein